eukprot:363738-Chlamydomonas_euryale.AAC.7
MGEEDHEGRGYGQGGAVQLSVAGHIPSNFTFWLPRLDTDTGACGQRGVWPVLAQPVEQTLQAQPHCHASSGHTVAPRRGTCRS